MRPLEVALAVLDTLALVAVAVRRAGSRRHRAGVALAACAVLVAVTQVVVEGARWQLLPLYAAAAALLVAATVRRPRDGGRPPRRWPRRLGVAGAVVLLVTGTALALAFPVFRLPEPGGPYGIGTLTYHWVDSGRHEIFSADPAARRELMAQVWYPTAREVRGAKAPYLPNAHAVSVAAGHFLSVPPFLFDQLALVRSQAVEAAPPAPAAPHGRAFPVVVYLSGIYGMRQGNTFQVQELVSHGYVVVGIDQPYTAAVVSLPDGREIPMPPRDQVEPLIDEAVHPAATVPTFEGRPMPGGVVPHLAQDVSFVLDRLAEVDAHDPQGRLTGRLDLRRTGLFGASLGGIVTAEACRVEPRLRACLVMDAEMPADVVRDGLRRPAMWITRDAATMRREQWPEPVIDSHRTSMRTGYERTRADAYFVEVPGMFHADITDLPLWSPLMRPLGLSGPFGAARAHDVITTCTLAFFDHELAGRADRLTAGPLAGHPTVTVQLRHGLE